MSDNEIGKKILARRKQLGLTLEDVGKSVGVGKSTVRKWENGMIKNMRGDKISALADVLQMEPVELVPMPTSGTKSVKISIKGKQNSLARAIVKANVTNNPDHAFELTLRESMPTLNVLDQDSKAMIKLWKVATPEAKKAAIGVLKSLNKPIKK